MTDLLAFAPLFPTAYMALASLVLLMVAAFAPNPRITATLTIAACVAMLGVILHSPVTGTASALATVTPFTLAAQGLILLVAASASLLASTAFSKADDKAEYHVLIALSATGAMVLVSATHFLTLYVGLELLSFPLYILAAFKRDSAASSESGLKYFVLGAMASGLLLFGVSLLYAATGTLEFAAAATALNAITGSPLAVTGMALVGVAFLFKLSVVPFHMWTPDVYEGAPTPVTALLATLPKVAAFIILIRVLNLPFAGLHELWQPALAALAAASMVAGSALAIVQTSLKRLLAYSAIANVGFMLTGVVAATAAGHAGVGAYLVIYSLTSLGLFAAVVVLERVTGAQLSTSHLKGLAQTNPSLAVGMLVLLFSLAGVPPLAGFMAKLSVFGAAVAAGYTSLAVVGVLASVVAAFYSLFLVKSMYFDAPVPQNDTANPSGSQNGVKNGTSNPLGGVTNPLDSPQITLVWLAVILSVALGVYPAPLLNALAAMAQGLL